MPSRLCAACCCPRWRGSSRWRAACGGIRAQSDDSSDINREYAIKAAYLYQFGRYVQWPADVVRQRPLALVIGVLGTDRSAASWRRSPAPSGSRGGRSSSAGSLRWRSTRPATFCLSPRPSARSKRRRRSKRRNGSPVLLVGEEPGFAEQGGTVNFFLEENRIRFEINIEVAKQDQLKISSKLLSLAKIVPERY